MSNRIETTSIPNGWTPRTLELINELTVQFEDDYNGPGLFVCPICFESINAHWKDGHCSDPGVVHDPDCPIGIAEITMKTSQLVTQESTLLHRTTWLADITSDPTMIHTKHESERIHQFACEIRDGLTSMSKSVPDWIVQGLQVIAGTNGIEIDMPRRYVQQMLNQIVAPLLKESKS